MQLKSSQMQFNSIQNMSVQWADSRDVNGLMQGRRNSSALAMELPQPCAKPSL